jgi:hypothetical protein
MNGEWFFVERISICFYRLLSVVDRGGAEKGSVDVSGLSFEGS